MNKKQHLLIVLILSFTLGLGITQKHAIKQLPLRNATSRPAIVYHDSNSNLPDTLHVKGSVVKISPGICGCFCVGAVVQVRLDLKVKNYKDSFAYLVAACLSPQVGIGCRVNVTASKLYGNETECYYRSINNSIDSKGTPFYKLSEFETYKIK